MDLEVKIGPTGLENGAIIEAEVVSCSVCGRFGTIELS